MSETQPSVDDEASDAHIRRMEQKAFAPGAFVMLHHEGKAYGKPHFDAGRIGKIVSNHGDKNLLVVQFFNDDLACSSDFMIFPKPHFAPVPEWMVEAYEPRAGKRGWRVNERGLEIFKNMGWGRTLATEGKA